MSFWSFSFTKTQNDLGVADRKATVTDEILKGRNGKFQQPQRVGHHDAAFADLGGNLLLSELKLFGELRVAVRFLDGIEIFALEIFDEREFEAARSSASRTMMGTSGNCRSCAARQRRSPAINSKWPSRSRTMSGWTMPCSRMESASSLQRFGGKSLRGWSGHGRIRSSGTRWTRSRVSGAGAGCRSGGRLNGRRLGAVGSKPDCRPATRRGRVPKQVLPCAQSVAGRGNCQCRVKQDAQDLQD
jgi:hypothetical protein